ncbi:L-2,4-diaminobutyric acid acetyltransferase [Pseudonocardia asaccharolytica DSM 44247 = NBRC 16224]|uniref:L-2,4-diaminobutyric acid acetyltransferase n=1 Tax=Pseudonocardia asaccharolytica DSM 44247 = NBRC 16224 TaxID=1123024 RepID=A0A511D827_9PSEU|nr:L-2,4-diaminobutyric acid acetyltransferase [Pseudonocardia asaccharolytica DSM 44247 = NBRC 16224]
MWRLATESQVLDVNSRYAYLLWCRDHAHTSVLARRHGAAVGFVTGYRRPAEPNTLFIWQVAVSAAARGHGIALRMLDALFDRVDGVDHLETTITPDNEASVRLFTAFAERRRAGIVRSELFGRPLLGGDHQAEILHRIGPIVRGSGNK